MTPTSRPFPPNRRRSAASLGVAALALTLGGCVGTEMLATTALVATTASGPSFLPIADYNDVPPAKAPIASPVRHVHQVQFRDGDGSLTVTEAELLDRFVKRLAPRYGDHLSIEAGASRGNGLNLQRADLVASYLSRQGYRAAIQSSDDRPVGRNAVNVVVASHVVTLPGCPDWTSKPGITYSNVPHSNWGCATATNLGMMVADPGHLNEGAPYQPLDGEYSVLAIQRYRKGEVRELAPEDVGVTQAQQKPGEDG